MKMGYRLGIGERDFDTEENRSFVKKIKLDDAPINANSAVFLEKTNVLMPSYNNWHRFLEEAELTSLFLDESGLIKIHPGVVSLTEEHLKAVKFANDNYKKLYYNQGVIDDLSYISFNLDRLNWLEWWMTWALSNCKDPIFTNG
jgi:hypothetical protein